MKGLLVSILCCCLSQLTYASSIGCDFAEVKDIQAQADEVIVRLDGQGWKLLGQYTDPALSTRLSMILSAQAIGKKIKLSFPIDSGVVCASDNYIVPPFKVKM